MTLANDSLTLVETFTLNVPVEELAPIVTALMARLETEGVAGLASMQFYTSPVAGEIGAVIRFANRSRLHEHIAMISSSPEFARFSKSSR